MKPAWFLAVVLLMVGCATRGFPPRIVNYDRVNASLYRGGQPNDLGVQWLRDAGIKSIINLRMANDVWPGEPLAAQECGIQYTNLPLHGFSAPTRAEVETILTTIERLPKPVFIHCQHGCDRTGTIVACYRIHRDGWTQKAALKEASVYGMSVFELEMKQFIREFKPL